VLARALFRSRTCYRCAFICSFSKFSGHRKSHASSNKATLHAWLFLAYNLSLGFLTHTHTPTTRPPLHPPLKDKLPFLRALFQFPTRTPTLIFGTTVTVRQFRRSGPVSFIYLHYSAPDRCISIKRWWS